MTPENHEDDKKSLSVDVIIPVYAERCEVLAATLSACLDQTYPISKILLVDGSLEPVSLPHWARSHSHICLVRLPENQGILPARNAATARSNACLLACVNPKVLPTPDWLCTCESHPGIPKAGRLPSRLKNPLGHPKPVRNLPLLIHTDAFRFQIVANLFAVS